MYLGIGYACHILVDNVLLGSTGIKARTVQKMNSHASTVSYLNTRHSFTLKCVNYFEFYSDIFYKNHTVRSALEVKPPDLHSVLFR